MADLVIHLAAARLCAVPVRSPVFRAGAFLGAALPDIVYKGFLYATASPQWYCVPSHAPLVFVVMAYWISLLFDRRERSALFGGLLVGGFSHILIDYGKRFLVPRAVPIFFPYSVKLYQGGWYASDSSVYVTIPALLLMIALGWVERRIHGEGAPDKSQIPTAKSQQNPKS